MKQDRRNKDVVKSSLGLVVSCCCLIKSVGILRVTSPNIFFFYTQHIVFLDNAGLKTQKQIPVLVLKLLLDLFEINSFADLGHLLQNKDINQGSKYFQYLLILDHLKFNYLWVFEL